MEKADKELVEVRNYIPSDFNFIMSTWLKGLRWGNSWFEHIDQEIYFDRYQKVIEFLLKREDCQIKVACLKNDPEVILGYSVAKGSQLDWIFVKSAWRAIGIAKSLAPKDIKQVSHLTKVGIGILKSRPEIKFNPFDM